MECELCGKNTELVKAKIEGTIISVCNNCARLGEVVLEAKPVQMKEKKGITIETAEIKPKFAEIIKNAREKSGFTREALAEKILEKVQIIERTEHGHRPTDLVARKLEKALGIKLLDYDEQKDVTEFRSEKSALTLGDVVKIKKKS